MNNKYLLIPVIFCISLIALGPLSAHTISHELEQSYSDTYFVLHFISKILPFIGLGMLTHDDPSQGKITGMKWMFIILLLISMLVGIGTHNDLSTILFNKISLIAIGILLLVAKDTNQPWLKGLSALFAVCLGFEFGILMLHTDQLLGYYVLILITGILIFVTLHSKQLVGNTRWQIVRYIFGLFLILSGISLVLLT